VLERAIAHKDMPAKLVTFFNDADDNHTGTLQAEINKLPGINTLKYPPVVRCGKVDQAFEAYLQATRFVPTFTFVDPWGYKGLSLKLVNGVIKDWGCDCVFFLNYNRVNAGFDNPAVRIHIDALFGEERANLMRPVLATLSPDGREAYILENLAQAIKQMAPKVYVLPFRFRSLKGTRTTHILVFVSKHFRGYEIMKDIMSKESSAAHEGVATFTYSPADAHTPLLFALSSHSLSSLKSSLLTDFAGQAITHERLYERHSVDKPYVRPNYRKVLLELEAEQKITCSEHRKNTLAPHITIAFP
jgi:three-Cys-motif partner protein